MDFNIYAGLSGGFGGAEYKGTFKDYTQTEADAEAFNLACEDYEMYEGYHGVMSFADVMEDLGYSDEDLDEVYEEVLEAYYDERDGWLDYKAIPIDEDENFESLGTEITYLN